MLVVRLNPNIMKVSHQNQTFDRHAHVEPTMVKMEDLGAVRCGCEIILIVVALLVSDDE